MFVPPTYVVPHRCSQLWSKPKVLIIQANGGEQIQIWSKQSDVLKMSKINSSPLRFCGSYSTQKEKVTDEGGIVGRLGTYGVAPSLNRGRP